MRKYTSGEEIKTGDVFTDGSTGREDVRLKNRAKVLYVDRYTLVWFPLNEFTTHSWGFVSMSHCLSAKPIKVLLENLSEQELEIYNNTKKYI